MKIMIALIIFLSVPSCAAESDDSKIQKINSILDFMQLEKLMETGRQACIEGSKQRYDSPDSILAKKGEYAGRTKSSKEWPKIEAAYDQYIQKTCSYIENKTLRQAYIEFYKARLSENDLDVLLKFYSTPAGGNFMRSQDDLVKYISKYYSDLAAKVQEKAAREYSDKINGLKKNDCYFFAQTDLFLCSLCNIRLA